MQNKFNRRSIRLQGYNYGQEGAYYVTLCVKDKRCLFGEVKDREMILNETGEMIEHWLLEVTNKFKEISIAQYVIMPDHIHVIIVNRIVGVDLCVNPKCVRVDLCVTPYMPIQNRWMHPPMRAHMQTSMRAHT